MEMMKKVYSAFLNAGMSPNQARAFAAEVGRENGFQERYIYGSHSDPANKKTNVGFLSWQGSRRDQLLSLLRQRGLLNANGSIKRGQPALDTMARFVVREINTNPSYARTKNTVLANPNVDYKTANRVIGKNYVRWDYDGNSLGKAVGTHHKKRDDYYKKLGGVISSADAALTPYLDSGVIETAAIDPPPLYAELPSSFLQPIAAGGEGQTAGGDAPFLSTAQLSAIMPVQQPRASGAPNITDSLFTPIMWGNNG